MYPWDWEQLGITPTRDVAAIKRAYAVRLRVTRPDDDAQAYQALREAYDRAQHWARHVFDAAQDDEDEVEHADEVGERADAAHAPAELHGPALEWAHTVAALPDVEAPPEVVLPPLETPELLSRQAFETWTRDGEAALLDRWPQLEAALSSLPLAQQAEASARFADMVIRAPNLPALFLRRLQDHFGWLGDFRTDRIIGAARAEALREALAEVVVRPVNDLAVLHRHADVLRLHRLLHERGRVAGAIYAVLFGGALEQRFHEAGSRLLQRLGVSVNEQSDIAHVLSAALWLRVAGLAGIAYLGNLWVSRVSPSLALAGTAFAFVMSFLAYFAMLIVGTKVSSAFNGSVPLAESLAGRLRRWRASSAGPWWGLFAMVAGTAVFGLALNDPAPGWLWLGALLVIGIGVVPNWPARPDRGALAAGVWAFLSVCMSRYVPLDDSFGVVFGAAGVLTMFSVVLMERDLVHLAGSLPLRILAGAGVWITLSLWLGGKGDQLPLGALLVLTLVMPLLPMLLAERHGHRFALAPMALASALAHTAGSASAGQWLLVGWMFAMALLFVVQKAASALAGAKLFGAASQVV